jgi:hypothetical protein
MNDRRQESLFGNPPRKPARVLMRVVDAGDPGVATVYRWFVHLKCPRCSHDAGWWQCATKRIAESQPCPKCTTHGATDAQPD